MLYKNKTGSRQGLRLPVARILLFQFLTPYKTESKVIAQILVYHTLLRIASVNLHFGLVCTASMKNLKF